MKEENLKKKQIPEGGFFHLTKFVQDSLKSTVAKNLNNEENLIDILKFDENNSIKLIWRKKDEGSIYFHDYFKIYRFSWDNYEFGIILKKEIADNQTWDRRIRHRNYFQMIPNEPFKFDSKNNIFLLQLQLAPLDTELKKKYGRSQIQLQINHEIEIKWINFIQIYSKLDLKKKQELHKLVNEHITFFTRNSKFSFSIPKLTNTSTKYETVNEFQKISKTSNSQLINSQKSKEIFQLSNIINCLYNKSPLILENHYCIPLHIIPKSFFPEILINKWQINEWKELFPNLFVENTPTLDFLNNQPNLMIDTRHFSSKFYSELIAAIPNFEQKIIGWVVQSDNRRVLKFILPRFANKIDCIYMDPPYNTGGREFTYHDIQSDADWIQLLDEILEYFPKIGTHNLNFFISIDDNEYSKLDLLISEKFGKSSLIGPIIVQINKGGRDYLPLAKTHEYIIVGTLNSDKPNFFELPAQLSGKIFQDTKGHFIVRELRNRNPKFNRSNRPNLFYPFYIDPQSKNLNQFCTVSLKPTDNHVIEVLPHTSKDIEDCWRWSKKKVLENLDSNDASNSEIVARQKREGGWNIYEKHRKSTKKAKTIWIEPEVRTEAGTIDLRHLFQKPVFDHPKPVALIEKCLRIGSSNSSLILDPFAGSGTTAHAVIKLNQEQGNTRKFFLIESSDLCKRVILPRIKKISYSLNWHEGNPIYSEKISNSSIIQYFSLEQFDDVLINTQFPNLNRTLLNFKDNLSFPDSFFFKILNERKKDFNELRLKESNYSRNIYYQLLKMNGNKNEKRNGNKNVNKNDQRTNKTILEGFEFSIILNQENGYNNHYLFTYQPFVQSLKKVDLVESFIWMLGLSGIKKTKFRLSLSHQIAVDYYVSTGNRHKELYIIICREIDENNLKQDSENIKEKILPKISKNLENIRLFVNFPCSISSANILEDYFTNKFKFNFNFKVE
ncbi:MAG: site-specific DNA-methyltransferase [Candidatus Lokiarchaeota archaeon]|nr:site-specific DNA-methyltransferase [Candidatus Harpocratesius repetitus]